MHASRKQVSVVMPVYGAERFVEAAVRSVLGQTHPALEILVVDDASPDRSIEICERFPDPRVRILRHDENLGLAAARNTAIRHARGDYLAFLDADDLWLPTKLEKHLAHLEARPRVGVSFSRSAFIEEDDRPAHYYQMPQLAGIDAERMLCRNPIGNGSAPVIRREVFEAIRFSDDSRTGSTDCYFDQTLRRSEDVECWVRIALQTDWQIEGIPEALTLYRINSSGLSAKVFAQLEGFEQALAKLRRIAPELVARTEATARAYQLRYLARRAIRLQDGPLALALALRALHTHRSIVLSEPGRTLMTLGVAGLLRVAPGLYRWLEPPGIRLLGALQHQRIERELRRARHRTGLIGA